MSRHARRLLVESMLAVAVFVGGLVVFGHAATFVRYHDDESRYIARARFFRYLFVDRDFSRGSWDDNTATHTQPMLANYLVGAGLWAQGHDLLEVNLRVLLPVDPLLSPDVSPDEERIDRQLLGKARATMVWVSAASALVLYLLGRVLGGPVAGLGAAALLLTSPLGYRYLGQARAEPLLVLLLLIGLLVGALGLRGSRTGGLGGGWAVALGVALGLGFGTKLTGLLGLAAVAAWAGLAGSLTVWRSRGRGLRRSLGEALGTAGGWLVVLAIAADVFVISNPHLYPNPILHTAHLFEWRVEENAGQQLRWPSFYVANPLERPLHVLRDSLQTGAVGISAVLAPLGLGVLLLRSWVAWRRSRQLTADGFVLLSVLAWGTGVSVGLVMAWDRYFVPTMVLGALLSGIALSALPGYAARMAAALVDRRPGLRPTSLRIAGAARSWLGTLAPAPARSLLSPWIALLLGLILLAGAAFRLVLIAHAPAFILLGDSEEFYNAGQQLVQTGEFPLPLKRAPLFPLFISGVILVAGESLEVISLVQHLLGLVTVALVYLLGALIFGRTTGLLAALATAINGSLLLMEHTIGAEAVFTPILLLALLLLLLALRPARDAGTRGRGDAENSPFPASPRLPVSPSPRPRVPASLPLSLAVGLLLGLAALARPATQAVVPLVVGVLALQEWTWRRRATSVALLCLGFVLVVTPWMLRNRATWGVTSISGGLGDSLMERTRRHDTGFELRDHGQTTLDPEASAIRARIYELSQLPWGVSRIRRTVQAEYELSDARADAVLRDAGLNLIRQQPDYYLQSTLEMFWRVMLGAERSLDEFWVRRGNPNYVADRDIVELLTTLYQDLRFGGPIVLLFLLGSVRCLIGWRRGYVLLPILVISQILLYVALDGPLARYRYPTQPLITLLACGGITLVLGQLARTPLLQWLRDRFPRARGRQLTDSREPGRVPV